MAMFNGESVGTVEYDFTDFGYPEDKGRIPEPSRHLMADVMDEIQAVFKRLRGEDVDPEDREAVAAALDRVGDEYAQGMDIGDMTDGLLIPVARLCGNIPKYETQPDTDNPGETIEVIVSWDESGGHPKYSSIEGLGFRIFLGFMSYCMEQMTSPEASSGGSGQSSAVTTKRPPTRQIRKLQRR